MNGDKTVLLIGRDPALIDFSKPGYPPGMNAAKVLAAPQRVGRGIDAPRL